MALPEEKTNSTPDWLTAGSTRIDKPVTQIRGGSIFIPKEPEKPEEKFVTLTPEQAAIERLDPTGVYQRSTTTNKIFRLEGPEKPAKTFPEGAANKLTEDVNQVEALTRALGGFQDDFAGSFLTGAESALQGAGLDFGMATPGQRNWWADFNSTDNIIRNKLFGSTLTDGEKAAYLATTIAPYTDPQIIKENLQKRLDIIKKATERRYNRYIAAGYNPAEVEATVGDVDFRILPQEVPADAGAATGAEPATGGDNRIGQLQQAFDANASLEDLMALAANLQITLNPTDLQKSIEFRNAGGVGAQILPPPTVGTQQVQPSETSIGESLYAAGGDIAQTAGDVLGLVGNPANAAVNALFGTNLSTNLGETFREATGAPRGDPLASAINRGLGTAMTGLGSASLAARTLPQAGRQIATLLTELPTQQIIGGGTGAAASEVVRQQGGGPVAQTVAGLVGGTTPAAVVRPRPTSVPTTATAPTTSAMEALIAQPTGREIVEAGKQANIPIMTSDLPSRQPTTFIGAGAQRAAERIPIVGTGGLRATQQQAREDAVRDFLVENSGAIPKDASERLVADAVRKNADTLDKYSTSKKEVFSNVSTAGAVPPSNALQKIDEQIAILSSRRTTAGDEAVAKLQELRQKLVDDRDIYQMESFRSDELGNAFNDANLSIGASNLVQRAVRNVYGPLNEDIGQFILQNGGKQDYTKWRVANARLSAGLEEAKRKSLKAILQRGEADPQTIEAMLFSGKKSDVAAFYRALTPEGQSLARMAVVNRIAEKMGTGSVSPEKFVSQVEKQANQIGVFFSDAQQKDLKGLVRALNATSRGGQAPIMTKSGQENYFPIIAGLFGIGLDTFKTGGVGTGLAAAFIAGARLYESKPVRTLFAALDKTKAGSEQERAIIGKINEKFAPIVATLSAVESEEEASTAEMPQ
jgi:hypothetical protein